MDKETRRDIAWNYWLAIIGAVLFLGLGFWAHGNQPPPTGTYFVALAIIIHAHGNRIRETMIALHEGPKK